MLTRIVSCLAVLAAVSTLACTTWISMPDSNELGQIHLHKNRDYGKGKDLPVFLHFSRREKDRYGWFTLCNSFYVNETGLSIMNNAMPQAKDLPEGARFRNHSFALMKDIAGNCATVQEAIALIQNRIEQGKELSTSKFLLTDGKEAGMLELSITHFAYHPIKTGFMVHTNDYIFPEMMQYAKGKPQGFIKSATRLLVTRKLLQEACRGKKLSIRDHLDISRYRDDAAFPDQAPFRNTTVCAADYICDKEFPGMLGTILLQAGPPTCSIALPVAIGCRKLPDSFKGALGKLAFQLKHAASPAHPYRKEMNTLEKRFWTEYLTTREEARKLLRENKPQEAQDLLETLLGKQAEEACQLMQELLKKAEKA